MCCSMADSSRWLEKARERITKTGGETDHVTEREKDNLCMQRNDWVGKMVQREQEIGY